VRLQDLERHVLGWNRGPDMMSDLIPSLYFDFLRGGAPEPLAGLGLLEGSLTVHADGEPERLPVWLAGIRDGTLPGGWALDDGVGLLFAGLNMQRAVSSRPGASAQRVDQVAGELVRTRLEPELLGAGETAALGGFDEAVHELRRVRRMRRGLG